MLSERKKTDNIMFAQVKYAQRYSVYGFNGFAYWWMNLGE